MFTARNKGRLAIGAVVVGAALALSGCASSDPLSSGSSSGSGDADSKTITVGSAGFLESEIIAEVYAQALENAGYTVKRSFQIGEREVYTTSLESGEIDLVPDYSGNLLQFYAPDTTATSSDDVYAALPDALPDGIEVLDQSEAQDGDSYTVTRAFADQYGLTEIGDLAKVDVPLTLGGGPALEERPYGPKGALSVYGVTIGFQATGDTTLDALVAGTVNVADVFTTDPGIAANDLVVLDDPKNLLLAQNVLPLIRSDYADDVAAILNPVSAALTTDTLIAFNTSSSVDQESSAQIATDWLTEQGLIK